MDFLTPDQVFLFETNKKLAHLIVVKLKSKTLDITTSKGFEIMLKKFMMILLNYFKHQNPIRPQEIFLFITN